ncbi:MAG TPA: thioredoxin domain-containing protein, partial [bacterium]
GKIKVGKLNVDDNQNTAMQFGIRSIPTLLIFKNGQEAARLIGVRPKRELVDTLNYYLTESVAA